MASMQSPNIPNECSKNRRHVTLQTPHVGKYFPIRKRIDGISHAAWLQSYRAQQLQRFNTVLRTKIKSSDEIQADLKQYINKGNLQENAPKTSFLLDGFYIMKHCNADDPEEIFCLKIQNKHLNLANTEDFHLFTNLMFIDAEDNLLQFEIFSEFNHLAQLKLPLNKLKNLNVDLGEFPHLQYLDLSYNYLTGDCFRCLGLLPNLQYLNLGNNNISFLPIESTKCFMLKESLNVHYLRFPRLEVLKLNNNQLESPDIFIPLANLTQLIYLDLEGNSIYHIPHLQRDKNNGRIVPANSIFYGVDGFSNNDKVHDDKSKDMKGVTKPDKKIEEKKPNDKADESLQGKNLDEETPDDTNLVNKISEDNRENQHPERLTGNKEGSPDSRERFPGVGEGLPGIGEGIPNSREGLSDNKEGLPSSKEGLSGNKEGLPDSKNGTPNGGERLTDSKEDLPDTKGELSGYREELEGSKEGLPGNVEGLGSNEGVSGNVEGLANSFEELEGSEELFVGSLERLEGSKAGLAGSLEILEDDNEVYDSWKQPHGSIEELCSSSKEVLYGSMEEFHSSKDGSAFTIEALYSSVQEGSFIAGSGSRVSLISSDFSSDELILSHSSATDMLLLEEIPSLDNINLFASRKKHETVPKESEQDISATLLAETVPSMVEAEEEEVEEEVEVKVTKSELDVQLETEVVPTEEPEILSDAHSLEYTDQSLYSQLESGFSDATILQMKSQRCECYTTRPVKKQKYLAPFSQLTVLNLANNNVFSQEALMAVTNWPMFQQLLLFRNPIISNNRKKAISMLATELSEKLSVNIFCKPINRLNEYHLEIQPNDNRKIQSLIRKVPKVPVDQLMAIEGAPVFKEIIHEECKKVSLQRRSAHKPRNKTLLEKILTPETSKEKLEPDKRKTPPRENPSFFVTQIKDDEDKGMYNDDDAEYENYEYENEENENYSDNNPLKAKFKGYEILFDDKNFVTSNSVSKDKLSNISALREALKNDKSLRKRVAKADTQDLVLRPKKTTSKSLCEYEERIDRILQSIRVKASMEEVSLETIFNKPSLYRKEYKEASRLIKKIEKYYENNIFNQHRKQKSRYERNGLEF